MSPLPAYPKDLVILTADLDIENALRGVLRRWQSMGIRQLEEGRDYDLLRHPQRDAGCRSAAEVFLQEFVEMYDRTLVVFDHHGCGCDDHLPAEVEADLESRLANTGWEDRCAVVVIEPELEIWVWSDSPNVDSELGWSGYHPTLREWLVSQNLLTANATKPADPKEAMKRAMRYVKKPISPYVFARLAETVGLHRCNDRAFLKLKAVLGDWFADNQAEDLA